MPAVAANVCQLWQRAGTRPAPTKAPCWLTGGRRAMPLIAQGHIRSFTRLVERCQGDVAGGLPPHKRGPERPDRLELQWPVVSCRWTGTVEPAVAPMTCFALGSPRDGDRKAQGLSPRREALSQLSIPATSQPRSDDRKVHLRLWPAGGGARQSGFLRLERNWGRGRRC